MKLFSLREIGFSGDTEYIYVHTTVDSQEQFQKDCIDVLNCYGEELLANKEGLPIGTEEAFEIIDKYIATKGYKRAEFTGSFNHWWKAKLSAEDSLGKLLYPKLIKQIETHNNYDS